LNLVAEDGLLADCNSIDWLSLPRYDSDAVFARLLDPEASHWSIRPTAAYSSERVSCPAHSTAADRLR